MNQLLSDQSLRKTVIRHSRLVTNGYEQFNENNQPVLKNNLVVVHNGSIVNSNT